jgi:hypothetical protein
MKWWRKGRQKLLALPRTNLSRLTSRGTHFSENQQNTFECGWMSDNNNNTWFDPKSHTPSLFWSSNPDSRVWIWTRFGVDYTNPVTLGSDSDTFGLGVLNFPRWTLHKLWLLNGPQKFVAWSTIKGKAQNWVLLVCNTTIIRRAMLTTRFASATRSRSGARLYLYIQEVGQWDRYVYHLTWSRTEMT